jgi:hypothetical protein
MTRNKRRETAEWLWEQILIDAYTDYRWRAVFDALHEQLHRWERGELTHDEMDTEVHKAHMETQEAYKSLYYPKREELVLHGQLDAVWFKRWVSDHPAPPGIDLTRARQLREYFTVQDDPVPDHEAPV